jgi:hypothetical protein
MEDDKCRAYSFAEGVTMNGQPTEFTFFCQGGEDQNSLPAEIKEFLAQKIRTIVPVYDKGQTAIEHGSFVEYSRFEIVQHCYGGGESGCLEVLEIKNPPDNRCGFIIHSQSYHCSYFWEWETLADALFAFKTDAIGYAGSKGLKREVNCGLLTPWFFAIGNEKLLGDFAFPRGFQDHPVYRAGQKFLVFDEYHSPQVKTCLGARFVQEQSQSYANNTFSYHLVYWDDGTEFKTGHEYANPFVPSPRVLRGDELWVVEAIDQFHKLLKGDGAEFSLNFLDGSRFEGRLKPPSGKSFSPAGDYLVNVIFAGKNKSRQGWARDFSPTAEHPNVIDYVRSKLAETGKKVKSVEIVKKIVKAKGKKWKGVFYEKES